MTPRVFRGKALAIVQPDGNAGLVELTVSADGLQGASLKLIVQ